MRHTVHYVVYVATLRITGAMEKSAEVMKSMQQLVKVGEVAETMREMAKEMMKVDA
jgi:charged multivesicular body protein 3